MKRSIRPNCLKEIEEVRERLMDNVVLIAQHNTTQHNTRQHLLLLLPHYLLPSPTMATFLTAVVSIKPTLFSFQSESFTSLQPQSNAFALRVKAFPSLTKPISVSLPRMRLIPHATMETDTEEKPALDPSAESSRRVYIGNIPRTVTNEQLTQIVEEHGAVEQVQVLVSYLHPLLLHHHHLVSS